MFVRCNLHLRDRESNSSRSAAVVTVAPDLGVAPAESDRQARYLRTFFRLLYSWVHQSKQSLQVEGHFSNRLSHPEGTNLRPAETILTPETPDPRVERSITALARPAAEPAHRKSDAACPLATIRGGGKGN